MNRHTDGLRESFPGGSLNHLHGVFLPGFLWPNHFDLPGSQSIFVISQDPLI